jgi:uncharacterized protein Yka (UPF0111/DUF47 family)
MTQDEIIEMAKEIAVQYGKAERFQTWTHDFMMQRLMELVTVSAAAEREACAKVCDELQDVPATEPHHCAEDIRARGQA